MKVIDVVELDENGAVVNDQAEVINYFAGNDLPEGNYPTEDGEPINIAGEWLLISEPLEVENECLVHVKGINNGNTLVKLPNKYVAEDYLVDYDADEECPLGVDVLIREDGFNVEVVPGCDYRSQANVNNTLDGHQYTGYLGFKLNDDYFITYRDNQFQMISL
ncbi:MAG: hypothetical protein ACQERJ_05615 [Bacillota bacterium]